MIMKTTTRVIICCATLTLLLSTIAAGGLSVTLGDTTVDATDTDDGPDAETSGEMSTTASGTEPVFSDDDDDDAEEEDIEE